MLETTQRRDRRFGRRRGERGQSLVEFTLTAPLLIFLLLGLAELGSALNSYLTVVNTARDGARLYSQGNASHSTILTMVDKETERLQNGGPPTVIENCSTGAGVCITTSGTAPDAQAWVKVKVCYDHPVMFGIPVLFPDIIPMCSTTIMRRVL